MEQEKNTNFTKKDFEDLKKGDDDALGKLYIAYYPYVSAVLIKKYKIQEEMAQDAYSDVILKFGRLVTTKEISFTNLKGYLLKMALNEYLVNIRTQQRLDKNLENYHIEKNQEASDDQEALNLFGLILEEEDLETELKIKAIRWGIKRLKPSCRKILKLTIVKGIQPRHLVQKLGYKSPRVVTDRKLKCKKYLMELSMQRFQALLEKQLKK